ncbi:MAG: type II secretion system protein GspG [Candidatus Omnitrophica bacterium]|nr:type II secretion system protein GspG [Candidatus Omnitrophota bacterium]MCM8793653.1 type II secretion system protein GspG [Candidatus Omnitrophota bacterium]
MSIFTFQGIKNLEFFITLGVIFFLIFIFLIYLNLAMTKTKEILLLAELRNIRIALNLYKGLEGEYPDSLKELIDKEIYWTQAIHEVYKKKYLEHQRVDEEGFPIDPWHRRFIYDPETGKIFSQTKGYENW